MLHIGETQVNLGMPNAKVLYFGETKMGPIIGESGEPTPSGTVLHLYDRVDGKSTVAGFWTDGNGQRYAVCVADAAYRSGKQKWSRAADNTPLTDYSASESYKITSDINSSTWNTDTILNNYTASNYPAFNIARNALTVSVDNKNFLGCLPNAAELQMIYNDRATLDTYDTTLTEYSNNRLTIWNIGGNSTSRCWSSIECDKYYAWYLNKENTWKQNVGGSGKGVELGVIPVIEIPVDENGRVM